MTLPSGGASEAEDGGEQHASVGGERPPGPLAQHGRAGAAGGPAADAAAAGESDAVTSDSEGPACNIKNTFTPF